MSMKRRNGGSGAGAACMCLEERDQDPERRVSFSGRSEISESRRHHRKKQQQKNNTISLRYRAGEVDTDQKITTENQGLSLSGLFVQPGLHGDNMGAVVGTLTMQAKQRRPSRGTSAAVQWRDEQQGQTEEGREQTSLKIWKKCSSETVHDACQNYYYCSLPVPVSTECIV